MDYQQQRAVLTQHFEQLLATAKSNLDKTGPVSGLDRDTLASTLAMNVQDLAEGSLLPDHDRDAVSQFAQLYGLPTDLQTDPAFSRAFKQAHRDYCKAVIAHSDGLESFDLGASIQGSTSPVVEDVLLSHLVADFWKYAKIEGRWIPKTANEKQEHVDLLYEALGQDVHVKSIGRVQARRIRDILVALPVNRNKLPHTRGKTLGELAKMPGLRTLHTLTINKHLTTYNGLFNWAERNGYCAENPFSGLKVSADKNLDEAPRLPFDDNALDAICRALVDTGRGTLPHHRWGTLVALYSGARLNEVAQLDLDDVKLLEGVWCFDINRNGGYKKLKNKTSKRVIPVHPRLIAHGFLDYVDEMRIQTGNTRLFPQLTYTSSDGYGRNLGRWVNETLLPELGIKTKERTFHSLRHSMIAQLIKGKVSQEHIMAIVGHEPGSTTLTTYNRNGFPPKQLLEAIEKAYRPIIPSQVQMSA